MKMVEGTVANLSAITAIGTGLCFVAAYSYDLGFYQQIGAGSLQLLTSGDYLQSLRDAFLEGLLAAFAYVFVGIDLAHGIFHKRFKPYLIAVLFTEGPIPRGAIAPLTKAITTVWLIGTVILIVFSVLFYSGFAASNYTSWLDAVLAVGLFMFTFPGAMLVISEPAHLIIRRILAGSLIVFFAFVSLYAKGNSDARELLYSTQPTAILVQDSNQSIRCVIIRIIANGYLIK